MPMTSFVDMVETALTSVVTGVPLKCPKTTPCIIPSSLISSASGYHIVLFHSNISLNSSVQGVPHQTLGFFVALAVSSSSTSEPLFLDLDTSFVEAVEAALMRFHESKGLDLLGFLALLS